MTSRLTSGMTSDMISGMTSGMTSAVTFMLAMLAVAVVNATENTTVSPDRQLSCSTGCPLYHYCEAMWHPGDVTGHVTCQPCRHVCEDLNVTSPPQQSTCQRECPDVFMDLLTGNLTLDDLSNNTLSVTVGTAEYDASRRWLAGSLSFFASLIFLVILWATAKRTQARCGGAPPTEEELILSEMDQSEAIIVSSSLQDEAASLPLSDRGSSAFYGATQLEAEVNTENPHGAVYM